MLNRKPSYPLASTLLMVSFLSCALSISAQSAREIVLKKENLPPNPQEPLETLNLQINGEPIAFGQKFAIAEGWAKSISFDVRNVSERVIAYFSVDLLLRVPGKPTQVITMMSHGQNATRHGIKPTVKFLPGEIAHVAFTDNTYKSFQYWAQQADAEKITQASLEIDRVLFEDDVMWSRGRLHRRAAFNPSAWAIIGEEHVIRPPSANPITKKPLSGLAVIEVSAQPDAPLLLSLSTVFTTNPSKPQISFNLENLGDKPVRSYAVRCDALSGKTERSELVFGTPSVLDWLMQRGQWQGIFYMFDGRDIPPDHLALSLDFVEFEDGTTWGPDTFKSAEQLVAQRVGAKLEQTRLLQVLTAGGLEALVQVLQPPAFRATVEPVPEPAKSQRLGQTMLRNFLLRIYKNEGATALVEALKNPPAHLIK